VLVKEMWSSGRWPSRSTTSHAARTQRERVRDSERAKEPTSFRGSARAVFFFGKLGEPGLDGTRKMAPGLEVEAAVATRARGVGMRVP
jgi:hypothetical protein